MTDFLYVISFLAFSFLLYKSIALFCKVRNNDLGYEEIITFSIIILCCLNMFVDVIRLMGEVTTYVDYNFAFYKHILYSSKVFEALIGYAMIKYIDRIYNRCIDCEIPTGLDVIK